MGIFGDMFDLNGDGKLDSTEKEMELFFFMNMIEEEEKKKAQDESGYLEFDETTDD